MGGGGGEVERARAITGQRKRRVRGGIIMIEAEDDTAAKTNGRTATAANDHPTRWTSCPWCIRRCPRFRHLTRRNHYGRSPNVVGATMALASSTSSPGIDRTRKQEVNITELHTNGGSALLEAAAEEDHEQGGARRAHQPPIPFWRLF